MLRNLYIVNSVPFRPTRVCLKITGPFGSLILTAKAQNKRSGERTIKAIEEQVMSTVLLMICLKRILCGCCQMSERFNLLSVKKLPFVLLNSFNLPSISRLSFSW